MANYQELKKNLSKELDLMFVDYNRILSKVLSLNEKILELYKVSSLSKNSRDFIKFVENDERMQKFTTLSIALMYSKDPTNEEVIHKLLDDIQLNLEELNNKR